MRPSEAALFTSKEQTLLVATETARLDHLNEDDLIALLGRVRRARNKYSDLHRRQGAGVVRSAGKRYAAATSNKRTLRKAEIYEDAVSRVARYVSRAARANANDLKDQRLEDARASKGNPMSANDAPGKRKRPPGTRTARRSEDIVTPQRRGATSAANRRNQSKKDSRTSNAG